MTMSTDEITGFLNRLDPPLLGVVGTIDSAGYPSTIPVWYLFEDAIIHIWTTTKRAWPKHLLREPKASFAVLENEPPFAAVLIKGTAEIVVDAVDHWAKVRRITERYIAAGEVDAYMEPWPMLDTMCLIHPEKFITWKRGY